MIHVCVNTVEAIGGVGASEAGSLTIEVSQEHILFTYRVQLGSCFISVKSVKWK